MIQNGILKRKKKLKQLFENFRLTKIGWQKPCKMLFYDSPEWDVLEKVTEYFFICKGFNFDYLEGPDFLKYNGDYDFD